MALSVISVPRSSLVAFGAKRTLTVPHSPNRIMGARFSEHARFIFDLSAIALPFFLLALPQTAFVGAGNGKNAKSALSANRAAPARVGSNWQAT